MTKVVKGRGATQTCSLTEAITVVKSCSNCSKRVDSLLVPILASLNPPAVEGAPASSPSASAVTPTASKFTCPECVQEGCSLPVFCKILNSYEGELRYESAESVATEGIEAFLKMEELNDVEGEGKEEGKSYSVFVKYTNKSNWHNEYVVISEKQMAAEYAPLMRKFNELKSSVELYSSSFPSTVAHCEGSSIEKIVAIKDGNALVKWMGLDYLSASWEPLDKVKAMDELAYLRFAWFQYRYKHLDACPSYNSVTPKFVEQIRSDCKAAPVGKRMFAYQREGASWMYNMYLSNKSCLLADELGLCKPVEVMGLLSLIDLVTGDLTVPTDRKKQVEEKKKPGPYAVRDPYLIITNKLSIHEWKHHAEVVVPHLSTLVYNGAEENRQHMRNLEFFYFDYDEDENITSAEDSVPNEMYDSDHIKFDIMIVDLEILKLDIQILRKVRWRCFFLDMGLTPLNEEVVRLLDRMDNTIRRFILVDTHDQFLRDSQQLYFLTHFINRRAWTAAETENFEPSINSIRQAIKQYTLSRTRADAFGRSRHEIGYRECLVPVPLTPIQASLYCKMVADSKGRAGRNGPGEEQEASHIVATRLYRMCLHPFLVYDKKALEERYKDTTTEYSNMFLKFSGKCAVLKSILNKLAKGNERVIVVCQFPAALKLLEMFFRSIGIDRDGSYGSSSVKKEDGSTYCLLGKNATYNRQVGDDKSKLVLLSPGFEPLDHVGAVKSQIRNVILFDGPFTPECEVNYASLALTMKPDLEDKLVFFSLVCVSTIEEALLRASLLTLPQYRPLNGKDVQFPLLLPVMLTSIIEFEDSKPSSRFDEVNNMCSYSDEQIECLFDQTKVAERMPSVWKTGKGTGPKPPFRSRYFFIWNYMDANESPFKDFRNKSLYDELSSSWVSTNQWNAYKGANKLNESARATTCSRCLLTGHEAATCNLEECVEIEFGPEIGKLGISLDTRYHLEAVTHVAEYSVFIKCIQEESLPEIKAKLKAGMLLVAVNGTSALTKHMNQILELAATRPLKLCFLDYEKSLLRSHVQVTSVIKTINQREVMESYKQKSYAASKPVAAVARERSGTSVASNYSEEIREGTPIMPAQLPTHEAPAMVPAGPTSLATRVDGKAPPPRERPPPARPVVNRPAPVPAGVPTQAPAFKGGRAVEMPRETDVPPYEVWEGSAIYVIEFPNIIQVRVDDRTNAPLGVLLTNLGEEGYGPFEVSATIGSISPNSIASRIPSLRPGLHIIRVNNIQTLDKSFEETKALLRLSNRPLWLELVDHLPRHKYFKKHLSRKRKLEVLGGESASSSVGGGRIVTCPRCSQDVNYLPVVTLPHVPESCFLKAQFVEGTIRPSNEVLSMICYLNDPTKTDRDRVMITKTVGVNTGPSMFHNPVSAPLDGPLRQALLDVIKNKGTPNWEAAAQGIQVPHPSLLACLFGNVIMNEARTAQRESVIAAVRKYIKSSSATIWSSLTAVEAAIADGSLDAKCLDRHVCKTCGKDVGTYSDPHNLNKDRSFLLENLPINHFFNTAPSVAL